MGNSTNAFLEYKQGVIAKYIEWKKGCGFEMKLVTSARACAELILKAAVIKKVKDEKNIDILEFDKPTYDILKGAKYFRNDLIGDFGVGQCYYIIKPTISSITIRDCFKFIREEGNKHTHNPISATEPIALQIDTMLRSVTEWFFVEMGEPHWEIEHIFPVIDNLIERIAEKTTEKVGNIIVNENSKVLQAINTNNNIEIAFDAIPFDTTTSNYNILILPFRNNEKHNEISALGQNLLEGLKEKNEKDKLGIVVKYLSSHSLDFTSDQAKEIGKEFKADIVIWGNDSKPEGNLPHIILFYFVSIADSTIFKKGKTAKLQVRRLFDIMEGKLHLEIDDIIYWFLGNKFYREKNYNNALTNFQKIKNDKYKNDFLFFHIARCFSTLNSFDEAEKYYKKVLEINPKHLQTHVNCAYILEQKKDFRGAKRHYEKALKNDKKFDEAHDVYLNLANILQYKLDDAVGAEKNFKKALKINSESFEANGDYAVFLDDPANDIKGAKKHYEKALEINPQSIEMLNRYAFFLENKIGDYDSAKMNYEKSLNIEPSDPNTHFLYANFLKTKIKDFDTAFEHIVEFSVHYHDALKLNPAYKLNATSLLFSLEKVPRFYRFFRYKLLVLLYGQRD